MVPGPREPEPGDRRDGQQAGYSWETECISATAWSISSCGAPALRHCSLIAVWYDGQVVVDPAHQLGPADAEPPHPQHQRGAGAGRAASARPTAFEGCQSVSARKLPHEQHRLRPG